MVSFLPLTSLPLPSPLRHVKTPIRLPLSRAMLRMLAMVAMVGMVAMMAVVAVVLRPGAVETSWQIQPALRCEDGAHDEQQD